MQKFVTIYVHNFAYSQGFFDAASSSHGLVEEHLVEELAAGWSIKQISALGGMNENTMVSGWFGVVLEKNAGQ